MKLRPYLVATWAAVVEYSLGSLLDWRAFWTMMGGRHGR